MLFDEQQAKRQAARRRLVWLVFAALFVVIGTASVVYATGLFVREPFWARVIVYGELACFIALYFGVRRKLDADA